METATEQAKSEEQIKIDLEALINDPGWGESYIPHFLGGGRLVTTEGVHIMAEKAKAHWLVDAIFSHQNNIMRKSAMCRDFQIWTLDKSKGQGKDGRRYVLRGWADMGTPGIKPIVTQCISFSDFPLDHIKIYVERGGWRNSRGEQVVGMVAMLPAER